MRLIVASLALSLAVPAMAADLQWSWEQGQHRRYFMQAGIKFQANMPIGAEVRGEFSAQDMLITLLADCEAVEFGKKERVTLECKLEDIALMGAPGNAASSGLVTAVLEEWREHLKGTTYQLMLSPDGRILRGELIGVTFRSMNPRTKKIDAAMEILIDRVFATFDLQLPKAGKTWEDGWIGKTAQSMMIPTATGGAGQNKVEYAVDQIDGNNVDVLTTGHGTIMEGMDVDKAYAFESNGIARFDSGQGHLVAHAYRSVGELTGSSVTLPGRQSERAAAATAGDASDPSANSVRQTALNLQDAQFLSGGTYDPGTYLEVGRMFLIDGDATPNIGPTGALVYPTAESP